jgi:hypothetical protein
MARGSYCLATSVQEKTRRRLEDRRGSDGERSSNFGTAIARRQLRSQQYRGRSHVQGGQRSHVKAVRGRWCLATIMPATVLGLEPDLPRTVHRFPHAAGVRRWGSCGQRQRDKGPYQESNQQQSGGQTMHDLFREAQSTKDRLKMTADATWPQNVLPNKHPLRSESLSRARSRGR